MLDPAIAPISKPLKNILIRLRQCGDRDASKEANDDKQKRSLADALSRSVKKAKQTIDEAEDLRGFVEPVAINTLRHWGEHDGCPIPLIYSHNGDRIAIGQSDYSNITVRFQKIFTMISGELIFGPHWSRGNSIDYGAHSEPDFTRYRCRAAARFRRAGLASGHDPSRDSHTPRRGSRYCVSMSRTPPHLDRSLPDATSPHLKLAGLAHPRPAARRPMLTANEPGGGAPWGLILLNPSLTPISRSRHVESTHVSLVV